MNLEPSSLNNVIVNEYIEREKARERESEREREGEQSTCIVEKCLLNS